MLNGEHTAHSAYWPMPNENELSSMCPPLVRGFCAWIFFPLRSATFLVFFFAVTISSYEESGDHRVRVFALCYLGSATSLELLKGEATNGQWLLMFEFLGSYLCNRKRCAKDDRQTKNISRTRDDNGPASCNAVGVPFH